MPAAAGRAEGKQAAAQAASDQTHRSPGYDGRTQVKVHSVPAQMSHILFGFTFMLMVGAGKENIFMFLILAGATLKSSRFRYYLCMYFHLCHIQKRY